MSAVRSLALSPRRTVFLVAGVAAVLLLAAALVVEPPHRSTSSGGGAGVEVAAGPVTGGDAAVREADRDEAGSIAPGAGGAATDAAIGIGAQAAKADVVGPAPDAASIVAPHDGTLAPPSLDARIVRNGQVELRVRRAGFEDAWSDVQAIAGANGGSVIAASRSGAGDGPRTGTISMRIPTGRFDAAVERIRDIAGAEVRRLDVTSQDVTQEFVDVRSRLRHDRAVEGRLLALLAQTRGVSEVLAVQNRLDQVQEQIELSTGRLEYLDTMTSTSTVEATITTSAKAGAGGDDERAGGVLAQSLGDAADRFEGNLAGAIVWFGGALPALVLLAAIALAGRAAWRRTRHHHVPSEPAS